MIIKYSVDGQAFNLIAQVGSGYCVEPLYEDGDETIHGKQEIYTGKLYDTPPVEKYAKEVSEILANIRVLKETKSALQKEIQEKTNAHNLFMGRIKQYAALKDLETFISGGITHYVTVPDYGIIQIIPFKDATCANSRHELRLLTLFGNSKGNLAWNLERYSSSSSSYEYVFPCKSLDEAKQIATEKALEMAAKYEGKANSYAENVIATFKSIGIELPDGWMRKHNNQKAENIKNALAKKREEVAELEKLLNPVA